MRPIFLPTAPLRKPRTLCFCHPVAAMICARVNVMLLRPRVEFRGCCD